ncbi:MAG: methylenetetrahydrofolate reductase C-terminal domain-containing protein [Desulfatitalea sp.]|nr:methylenetetrahydrofolate reductase C-terminal domain-containing protein [Desulfatitalea sp.]
MNPQLPGLPIPMRWAPGRSLRSVGRSKGARPCATRGSVNALRTKSSIKGRAGCGTCIIHHFDGLCPIARCSKSLQHGPCGGSNHGKCEVSKELVCIWDLIVHKKMEQGRLEDLCKYRAAKDWRTARDGGPRRSIREELVR